jgi:hypothetical protein
MRLPRIGIGVNQGRIFSLLDAFGLYLNPFGANKTYSNNDVIPVSEGALKGTYTIVDTSTGNFSLVDDFLEGVGDDVSDTTTYLYGDEFTRSAGIVHVFSTIMIGTLNQLAFGVAKSDLSSWITNPSIRVTFANMFFRGDPKQANNGFSLYAERGNNAEVSFVFVLGGFNSSREPWTSGPTTDYSYGGFILIRGFKEPRLRLFAIDTGSSDTLLRPFFTVKDDSETPAIVRHAALNNPLDLPIPFEYIAESNTTPFNSEGSFLFHSDLHMEVGDNMKIKFFADSATPTDYIEVDITRPTNNLFFDVNEYLSGVPSLIVNKEIANVDNGGFILQYEDGNMYINFTGSPINFPISVIDASLQNNTIIITTNDGNSRFYNIKMYRNGNNNDEYNSYLPTYPYHEGSNPPGYGLPAETRKGWHFDVSSTSSTISVENTGVILELTNGSTSAKVRYRDFYRQRYIPELSFTVDLDFAYTGTSKKIAIVSDPHFGIEDTFDNNDATEIFTKIMNPDLISLGITDAFVLGDLVHDSDTYYADFKAAIADPVNTINWYTLTGNHDIFASWKTEFSQANTYYSVVIDNLNFILLGSEATTNSISAAAVTFLGNELTNNQDKNNIILGHTARYNTVRKSTTSAAYMTQAGSDHTPIETAIGSNNFVAWFSGHAHGYLGVKEPDNSVFLNLG